MTDDNKKHCSTKVYGAGMGFSGAYCSNRAQGLTADDQGCIVPPTYSQLFGGRAQDVSRSAVRRIGEHEGPDSLPPQGVWPFHFDEECRVKE